MRSKTLERVASTDSRVDAYEYDPGNDMGSHWLHLKWPYEVEGDGGSIHESTVRDCLDVLNSNVICGGCYKKPCQCLPDDAGDPS